MSPLSRSFQVSACSRPPEPITSIFIEWRTLTRSSVFVNNRKNYHRNKRSPPTGGNRGSAGVSPAAPRASCPRPLAPRLRLSQACFLVAPTAYLRGRHPSCRPRDRGSALRAGAGRSRHSGRDARATSAAHPRHTSSLGCRELERRWLRGGLLAVYNQTVGAKVIPKLTYEEFRQLPDDGKRYELIHGEVHLSPSRSTKH